MLTSAAVKGRDRRADCPDVKARAEPVCREYCEYPMQREALMYMYAVPARSRG